MNINKGKLIEQFNEQTNIIPVKRDDLRWKKIILPELKKFSIELVDKATIQHDNNKFGNKEDD